MSKFLDLILGVQFSTSIAWMCAIAAHLVANHANDNWQFGVYVLLVISLAFMLAPYGMFLNEENTTSEHQTTK